MGSNLPLLEDVLLIYEHDNVGQEKYQKRNQKLVRNDMDVNEHEKLSNITLRHQLK